MAAKTYDKIFKFLFLLCLKLVSIQSWNEFKVDRDFILFENNLVSFWKYF